MESRDLIEAHEAAKAEREPAALDRETASKLYARLDDAGLKARLTTADSPFSLEQREGTMQVVEVDTESITSIAHLRLIAQLVERHHLLVTGQWTTIRIHGKGS